MQDFFNKRFSYPLFYSTDHDTSSNDTIQKRIGHQSHVVRQPVGVGMKNNTHGDNKLYQDLII